MSNLKTLNTMCTLEAPPPVQGMVDGGAYICNLATWPIPLRYVRINAGNEAEPVQFIDARAAMEKLAYVDGKKIRDMSTADIGSFLVRLNSRMYNEENGNNPDFIHNFDELSRIREDIKTLLNGRLRKDLKNKDELGRLNELEKEERNLREAMTDIYSKDTPSLMVVQTMDMEFAHIRGYNGELIYQQDMETDQVVYDRYGRCPIYLDDDSMLLFQNWERQISDVEAAAISNPLRLLPLFSYDPRRYRLSNSDTRKNGWGMWMEPFTRILGHSDSADGVKKIWLGFCMNPTLGFRPFDEFCEHLPRFYNECEKNNIPILTQCIAGGVTAHNAECYFDKLDERIDRSKKRHEMMLKEGLASHPNDVLSSCMYYGEEYVFDERDNEYTDDGRDENLLEERDEYTDDESEISVLEEEEYIDDDGEESILDDDGEEYIDVEDRKEYIAINDEYDGLNYFYMNYGHPRNWIPVLEYFPNLRLCLSGFGGNSEWQQVVWSIDDTDVPTREWIRCIIKLTAKYKNVYADISGLNIYDENIRNRLIEMLKLIQDKDNNEFTHLKHKLIFGSGWHLTNLTELSSGGTGTDGEDIRHSYSNYCREFKNLVHAADRDGELWKQMSLINPWTFYALSEDKVNEMHNELSHETNEGITV